MERILFDNHNVNYDEMYDSFKEWCEINDIDCEQYDNESDYFYNWVNNELSIEWKDFMFELKHSKENDECVVKGYVGRWNGNFEIAPHTFDDLKTAIENCIQNCDYYVIKEIDGVIDIISIHHDASNHFTIEKKNGMFNIQF